MSAMLTMLAVLSVGAGAPPRGVAVVHSSWSDFAFRAEWDGPLKALGWRQESFENTRTPDLVARLDEFDIVVAASVANYEHTVDMAPYADQWRRFLQRGGLLLVTDASYDSVLDKWLGRLGPEFALGYRALPEGTSRASAAVGSSPVLSSPSDMARLLVERQTLWTELVPSPTSRWTPLLRLIDAGPVLVSQVVGRGCAVVTSHFSLQGAGGQAVAQALLTNFWQHVAATRAGVSLTELAPGEPRPGRHVLRLGLANAEAEPRRYQVDLEVGGNRAGGVSVMVAGGGQATAEVPYALTARGDIALTVRVSADDQPPAVFPVRQHVPELLTFELTTPHLYPWQDRLGGRVAMTLGNDLEGPAPRLVVSVDGGAERALAPGAVTIDASGLPLGDHRVECRVRQGDRVLASVERGFQRHAEPRVMVRPGDLTTLVDGQPFFPMGFYHVSWPFAAEDRLACLREIAAAGYNTVHASLKQMDEWQPFLDEAQRLGVMVITEFGVDMEQAIRRYRGHKAVLAWNPGDEPDGQGVAPEEMLARHNRIKSLDASVPTYMTLCVPSAYARYAAMAEVIAPDPYPIYHKSAEPAQVYRMIRSAVDTATPLGRPIWAIPQAFGYARPDTWRVPTPAEERAMTYLALIAGAKGLIYYTYRDTDFDMRANPELWAMMKTLPAEMRLLRPWLLEGVRHDLTAPDAKVTIGLWTRDGRRLLCLVNPAATEQRVELALPGVAALAEVLPGQAPSLAVRDGKVEGALGPLAVVVAEVR